MAVASNKELLTIEEASHYLNVSKSSLRRWTNSRKLTCHRVGLRKERRFDIKDLDAFLADSGPGNFMENVAYLGDGIRHVCLHFQTPDEQWALFRPYIVHHLERRAPILFILDKLKQEEFCERIAGEGFDPEELLRQGLLLLPHSSEVYLKKGTFSAIRMLDFMKRTFEELSAVGHTEILVSGEMSWNTQGVLGSEEMMLYETGLNDLLAKHPGCSAVCHYQTGAFSPEAILQAICVHPVMQLPNSLVPQVLPHSQVHNSLETKVERLQSADGQLISLRLG